MGSQSLNILKVNRCRRLRGVRPGFRFSQTGRGASDLTPAKPSDLSHRVEAIGKTRQPDLTPRSPPWLGLLISRTGFPLASLEVRSRERVVTSFRMKDGNRSYAVGRFPTATGVEMRGPGNLGSDTEGPRITYVPQIDSRICTLVN